MEMEEDDDPGIPEWVVTFGDMMSLLLTFFIMLLSMSEMKEDERSASVVASMRNQFGPTPAVAKVTSGEDQGNSSMKQTSSSGTTKRKHSEEGGVDQESIKGEDNQVQNVKPGEVSIVGGGIIFPEQSAELSQENRDKLAQLVSQLAGKPQRIEIRGHTTSRPPGKNSPYQTHMRLGFARAESVMHYFLEHNIERKRFRLTSVGESDPKYTQLIPELLKRNARVEIMLLDESTDSQEASN